jgi:hypothetical protein
VNLFWAIEGNMTALRRFESPHRFKTLSIRAEAAACFCECEVDFAGTSLESFPLRETRHDVSLNTCAAPTAFETSAVFEIGADVQIGGGVRVGDAFQAIVGSELIAI